MPMGFVVIPIGGLYPCEEFGRPIILNKRETIITCGSLTSPVCPKFKTCELFMARYEKKKDIQIEKIRSLDFSEREMQRLEIAEKISENPIFQKATKKTERMSVARLLVPYGTPEKIIAELVDLATSSTLNISEMKNIKEYSKESEIIKIGEKKKRFERLEGEDDIEI
jgi:hypothetical protein